ncbi:MAG: L-threonylcarbamoyladenylate synthase [Firmicutes bacterium]|nr:L-threonylcarbamoyladenylate synthase [Bacillota bacterium]
MNTKILQNNSENIKLVASTIKKGGIAAFFTETVYGLGANALNTDAIKKIYQIKGRPSDNPLIIHLDCVSKIKKYAHVTDIAKKVIDNFMPGAVTIVLNKKDIIPLEATGGLDSVAIRVVKSSLAKELIYECGMPICAPSANTSTRPSPTQAQHVLDDLNGKIEYILDGGSCEIGLESSVLDCRGERVVLLRHGGVGIEEIEKIAGKVAEYKFDGGAALSPGQKYKHYSPKAKIVYFEHGDNKKLEELKKSSINHKVVMGLDADDYARQLFSIFRDADKDGIDVIICELAIEKGIGKAINNRIKKAAYGN